MGAPLKFAIADPPYLGRAERWYGPSGCGIAHGEGQADNHDEAFKWDDEGTHAKLVEQLEQDFDGWAIAMSVHSLSTYLKIIDTDSRNGIRVCVWNKTSAVTSGSRIKNSWEPVSIKVPKDRRGYTIGQRVTDVLTCNPPRIGFMGAKPHQWTHWVCDLMGVQAEDSVTDLFVGSGLVTAALQQQRLDL